MPSYTVFSVFNAVDMTNTNCNESSCSRSPLKKVAFLASRIASLIFLLQRIVMKSIDRAKKRACTTNKASNHTAVPRPKMILHESKPIYPRFSFNGSAISGMGSYGMSKIGHSLRRSKLRRPSKLPKKLKTIGGYGILIPNSMAMKPRKTRDPKKELMKVLKPNSAITMIVFASFDCSAAFYMNSISLALA